jgi:hypothetical protein
MKTLLGTALAAAGMTFGVSYAYANPGIDVPGSGCGCDIVLRTGAVVTFSDNMLEHKEITNTESGNTNANCKVDLGTGPQVTFDTNSPLTKGFVCFIGGITTLDWKEVISADGQTTLTCKIH